MNQCHIQKLFNQSHGIFPRKRARTASNRLCLLTLVLLSSILFIIGCFNTSAIRARGINALYLWDYTYYILTDAAEQEHFFQLARKENFNTVFIQFSERTVPLLSPGKVFRSFISQAKISGIEVHALIGGNPSLLDNPGVHKPYIEGILKYNLENPDAAFAGINWDIEPLIGRAPAFTSYIRQVKSFTYSGQTIISQDILLSAYLDAPYWLGAGARELYREFDLICINSYGDTLDRVIEHAADGPEVAEEDGIDFAIGLETDEIATTDLTTYEKGWEGYHELTGAAYTYYADRYKHYRGQYVNHYEKAVSWWRMITSAEIPAGQFSHGEKLMAEVALKRSDSYPDAPIGVQLEITDQDNRTWNVSRIVVLGGEETKTVKFEWLVPVPGAYHTEISVWDLDYGGHSSSLLESISAADIERLSMEQLNSMQVEGKRDRFIELDSTARIKYPPALQEILGKFQNGLNLRKHE